MTEAAKDTPLASLMALRQQIADKQVLKLRIPRWDDPEILVSYKLVDRASFAKAQEPIFDLDLKDGAERAQASIDANADLLVRACISVELRGSEINAKFAGFNDQLAEALGLSIPTARATCQTLFIAEGDLWNHATELIRWSGLTERKVEDDFSGE